MVEVAELIESQVETVRPFPEFVVAHKMIEEVEANNIGSKILTPSDKILRIRMESVGLVNEPSAPDLDERAHAKAIVKYSHIPVTAATNSDSFDCKKVLFGSHCNSGLVGLLVLAPRSRILISGCSYIAGELRSVLRFPGKRETPHLYVSTTPTVPDQ
jgi:hypothetical protein